MHCPNNFREVFFGLWFLIISIVSKDYGHCFIALFFGLLAVILLGIGLQKEAGL